MGRSNSEWIYGLRPVLEALEVDGDQALSLEVSTGRKKGLEALIKLARQARVTVRKVPPVVLDERCRGGHHQGVALEVRPFQYAHFETWLSGIVSRPDALVVVMDQVQDPMNLGAMIRSAAAMGVAGVVLPERRASPVTPSVVRASAGTVRRLPVCRVANVSRALSQLKEAGFWVSGAGAGGGQPPWEVDLTGRVALVMGSEGKGMRRLVEKSCDFLLTIPLTAGVESLNVSAAAAMLLYEIRRQQRSFCRDRRDRLCQC